MVWLYRISKLDTISISSDILVSESIIIMPVVWTSDPVISPRKAVYIPNSQFVYIGSAAIDVLGAFFLVASSIASADNGSIPSRVSVAEWSKALVKKLSCGISGSNLAHFSFYSVRPIEM